MDGSHFDRLVSRLTETASRRRALGVLGVSALLAGGLSASDETEARRRRRKHRKGGKGNTTPPPGGTPLALRALCTPGQSTCASGLACDAPTTRHTCSSTVEGVDAWCCVPKGGNCTECDCCGNNFCNGAGVCATNPEGVP